LDKGPSKPSAVQAEPKAEAPAPAPAAEKKPAEIKEPPNVGRSYSNFFDRPREKKPAYSSPLPDGEDVTPHYTKKDIPTGGYNPREKNNLDLPSFLRNRD